jgi:hypothetical protein
LIFSTQLPNREHIYAVYIRARLVAEGEVQQLAESRETPSEVTTYNRQQFFWIVQGSRGFKTLAEDIGTTKAEAVVDLIFDSQVRETNPSDRYVIVSKEQSEYSNQIGSQLEAEATQIRQKRSYVTSLLKSTMAGDLRCNLLAMSEPESNYMVVRKLPRSGTPEYEIAKASDWVASSLHGDGREAVRDCLTRHILTQPAGLALGRTPAELLDKVHAELVTDSPRVRSPNSATAYPSSIGGRFLLELIFQWTSKIIWPGPGEEIWQDVALFYLGAIASVQGYPDGNKRAARMAYALTLLKARLPFVAPNLALQSALIQMNHTDQD